jgi:phosphoribosylglycinamide formyltransferase-1
MMGRKRVAIFISGRGSNMAALISAAGDPKYPAEISLVLSSSPDAPGLASATVSRVATAIFDSTKFERRALWEEAIEERLREAAIDLICLAGFMRVLTEKFVERWRDRLINIHPSLLPLFPGLDTHAKALAAGMKLHGCTVHYLRARVDSGPIIGQAAVPVLSGDTPATLAARVLTAEHRLYPLALALVASGRAPVVDERVALASLSPDATPSMLLSPPHS